MTVRAEAPEPQDRRAERTVLAAVMVLATGRIAITGADLARLRGVRSDSATALIPRDLPATPVLTSSTVQRIHGVSHVAADRALAELVSANVLTVHQRRGVRYYQAFEVLGLVTVTERRLASTTFDTRISPPVRPVPALPGVAI